MPDNGILTQKEIATRRNRTLFTMELMGQEEITGDNLWRNETQPGNTLDEQDEQCTAQSRPGMQPEYLGIDDYECNSTTLHYVLCMVPMI